MEDKQIKEIEGKLIYGENNLTTDEKRFIKELIQREISKPVKMGAHPQLWLLPTNFYLCPQCHVALCPVESEHTHELMYAPRCPRCGQKLEWQ